MMFFKNQEQHANGDTSRLTISLYLLLYVLHLLVARTCSLIFIVLDVLKPLGHKKLIEHELEGFGIRYALL